MSDLTMHGEAPRNILVALRHAAENCNAGSLSDTTLLAILSTGNGEGRAVRAIFGDCALDTLERAAAMANITSASLHEAYAVARDRHQAFNAQLENIVV